MSEGNTLCPSPDKMYYYCKPHGSWQSFTTHVLAAVSRARH